MSALRDYNNCVESSRPAALCARGFCTARQRYDKWSAYASGHAAQVCSGKISSFDGERYAEPRRSSGKRLHKWFEERWVNACDPRHPPCGRRRAAQTDKRADPTYPYCRPTKRVDSTTPTLLKDISAQDIRKRCAKKTADPNTKVYGRVRSKSPRARTRETWAWMSYKDAHSYEQEARAHGVSEVARGRGGFMRVYEKMKTPAKMASASVGSITWGQKRANFIARHMAGTWGYKQHPTYRRWLALIMWGYYPGPPPT